MPRKIVNFCVITKLLVQGKPKNIQKFDLLPLFIENFDPQNWVTQPLTVLPDWQFRLELVFSLAFLNVKCLFKRRINWFYRNVPKVRYQTGFFRSMQALKVAETASKCRLPVGVQQTNKTLSFVFRTLLKDHPNEELAKTTHKKVTKGHVCVLHEEISNL